MGPLATVDFLKPVRQTRAACGQGHLPFVVASLPQVPDRSDALPSGGASPLPAMLDGIGRLAAAGADLTVIACSTARAGHQKLGNHVGVPVLRIVGAVLDGLRGRGSFHGVVGLLATTGTVQAGIDQTTPR